MIFKDQLRNGDDGIALRLQRLENRRQSGGRILCAVVEQDDGTRFNFF